MPRPPTPRFRYPAPARAVLFLERPNRYLARVRRPDGGPGFEAHVPNPGRMEELLVPGTTRGWVVPSSGPNRRTRWDLVAVRYERATVSIDSRLANRLVGTALALGRLPEFGTGPWTPEVTFGDGRFDFGRRAGGRVTGLLEVKSSNFRVGRLALFPDAPTLRGVRHLRTLARAARRGIPSGLLFMVQHDRARAFAPNAALDPEFARALGLAHRAGVVLRARSMRVRPQGAEWGRPLPIDLPEGGRIPI